jgi:penicillin V acylase-like amidase (Ntn superfamily)
MLKEAEKYPPEYDEDSPKLTSEQLAQFKPVHFNTMEERAQAMREQKIPAIESK